jgi:PII-like signaling protein
MHGFKGERTLMRIHIGESRIEVLSLDLPIVIEVVETEERIQERTEGWRIDRAGAEG